MGIAAELMDKPLQLSPQTPVHFIGVAGIGMSGLAKILLEAGYPVSGSDLTKNKYTDTLEKLGGQVYQGHDTSHVPLGAQVVISTSIDPENPELVQARQLGLGIHHRSSLLREILQGSALGHKASIGITGTHGKTTSTGMTAVALKAAGLDITAIVGGNIPEFSSNAIFAPGRQYAVAELDESDGTLVQYQPQLSLITNLELDHADHFRGGLTELTQNITRFLSQLHAGSTVLFNLDCPKTVDLIAQLPAHCHAIGLTTGDTGISDKTEVTYWLKNVRHHGHGAYQGYAYKNDKLLGELHLELPGLHNLTNALGAIALGDQLGADFDDMADALRQFKGMGRRFEVIRQEKNAKWIDDYAHHPTEVAATLKTAKEMATQQNGRVIAVFQPHRYTRLQALWDEFTQCFTEADVVWITDVYHAHEAPIDGITAQDFVAAVNQPHVTYRPLVTDADRLALQQELAALAQPGDLILSMGAGSITRLFRDWEI